LNLRFLQSEAFKDSLADYEGDVLAALAERISLRSVPIWLRRAQTGAAGHPSEPKYTLYLRCLIATSALRQFPGNPELQLQSLRAGGSASWYFDHGDAFQPAANVLVYTNPAPDAYNHDRAAYDTFNAPYFGGRWALEEVHQDVISIESGEGLAGQPLWRKIPNKAEAEWHAVKAEWAAQGEVFSFWIRWYEAALLGNQLDPDLLKAVALIPDETWNAGSGAVAEATRAIEERHALDPIPAITGEMRMLPAGASTDVAVVRRAMVRHREVLPPTFDAVLGFITLEVELLQSRNYRDEDDAGEARRQISVLTILHQAIGAMKGLVPLAAEMPQRDAEKAEKLSRLIVRTFEEWPRANVSEMVDSTCRLALVGASTAMLPMIGVTVPYAFAAGLVFFGGKKMVDAVRVAKDAMKP
jgi:hypothetical protein